MVAGLDNICKEIRLDGSGGHKVSQGNQEGKIFEILVRARFICVIHVCHC